MMTDEIRSAIERLEQDRAILSEGRYRERADALDELDLMSIGPVDELLDRQQSHELIGLRRRAERLRRRLEGVDRALFQRLRADIRASALVGAAVRELIAQYAGSRDERRPDEVGFDSLDGFVNGLVGNETLPTPTLTLAPEMVYYQATPARVIVELVDRAGLTRDDVFYDLGSGLGRVPILVHLLSAVDARGVEIEPAYCDYARARAADLSLAGVRFIQADAREADYGEGTVFFLYTPFTAGVLRAVLGRLRDEARRRPIRLFTYGPCTAEVAREPWLARLDGDEGALYRLASFRSRQSGAEGRQA